LADDGPVLCTALRENDANALVAQLRALAGAGVLLDAAGAPIDSAAPQYSTVTSDADVAFSSLSDARAAGVVVDDDAMAAAYAEQIQQRTRPNAPQAASDVTADVRVVAP
jgi:hypothetical protein